jgi:anti-sigma regulatory factor (Ser/Thr protein kinase)
VTQTVPTPGATGLYTDVRARIAVYDGPLSAPLVEDVGPAPVRDFIEALAARVYELARTRGGDIPYTVIREIAENYIHAGFAEPVISILDSGTTVRFSDQGPGIPDKERATCPGYTTATSTMKHVIRGVGSGLPIVREFLAASGGSLAIEDNLHRGSVITITTKPRVERAPNDGAAPHDQSAAAASRGLSPGTSPLSDGYTALAAHSPHPAAADGTRSDSELFTRPEPVTAGPRLTTRQKQVLALVLESGAAGPSIVSRELGVGLSTAYRDLASLEDLGLISSDGGKRALTESGLAFLGEMSSNGL